MELQQHLDAIRREGLGVAAISYDSIGALKSFADRQHITYPLLSDPDSKIIRAFDILNETTKPGTLTYGIPYPGIYVVDAQGKVLSKYFEDDYKDRVSTADILTRQFGVPVSAAQRVNETKHLKLTTSASNDLAGPGLRIALSLKIEMKPACISTLPASRATFRSTGNWRMADLRPNDMHSNIQLRRYYGWKQSTRPFPFIAGASGSCGRSLSGKRPL